MRKQAREKEEAEFRMGNKDLINAISRSGVPVEDPTAYTPEDKDDLNFTLDMNISFQRK